MNEITMTLVEDVSKVIAGIARDFIPARKMEITVESDPPAAVLRVPGEPNSGISDALNSLSASLRHSLERTVPSQPFRFQVITGSEASGLKVIALPTDNVVYGHIIKAKLAYLRRSSPGKGN